MVLSLLEGITHKVAITIGISWPERKENHKKLNFSGYHVSTMLKGMSKRISICGYRYVSMGRLQTRDSRVKLIMSGDTLKVYRCRVRLMAIMMRYNLGVVALLEWV